MNIEVSKQEYSSLEVGRIVIDNAVDIVVVHKQDTYEVRVVKNKCFNIGVSEVEFAEDNPTIQYSYYWNEDTKLLTVYEDNKVLSTVSGVTSKRSAEEIYKEEVFNIAGVELE